MAFADGQANAVVIPLSEDGIAQVTLAGTVVVGDAVGFSSGWKRALATTGSVVQLRCVWLALKFVPGMKLLLSMSYCLTTQYGMTQSRLN